MGFRSATTEFPNACQAICQFVKRSGPALKFSSVGLFRTCEPNCHVDSHNSPTEPNYLFGISKFSGGVVDSWRQRKCASFLPGQGPLG